MTPARGKELILQQLAAGDAEPVLVADFPAFSVTPRLSELLGARAEGRPVYQIDPLGALSQDRLYLPLSELAAAYADAFLSCAPADGRVFVVGHCSAAALSLHIAKLLASAREVTAILLRPTWPGEENIRTLFAEFQANLGAANRPCPDLDRDPCRAVARMAQILRDEMIAVAVSRGLGESTDAFSDLLAWYRAWLAFLLACRNDSPISWVTEAAAVKVLTDAPAGVAVPGLSPDAYHISRLPILDQEAATPELAEFVLAQIASR